MQPHEERVEVEKQQLDEKLVKLDAFFSNPIFSKLPHDERRLLQIQYKLMNQYSRILAERLIRFKEESQ
jgi:hypothetical protein